MALQQESAFGQEGGGVQGDTAVHHHVTLTPKMVLSWLPKSATPAQQDSAIQAHFKPSEIRWSNRPDTLHLPGHDKGHSMMDVNLPQYYREGFFSKDSLFHPELPGGRHGVAGDPIPYTAQHDDVITSLLLLLFVLATIAFSNTRQFIVRQTKNFFNTSREGLTEITETAVEIRFQIFLTLLTSLLLAILFYFYTLNYIGDTFVLSSQYYLIGIFFGISIVYYLVKILLYTIVNNIFFDSKKNRQWMKSFLYITSIEGALLFPLVILWTFFHLSIQNAVIYVFIVLSIVKILKLFKCFLIFFRQNVVKLQIILYFCTLEIIPVLLFGGALVFTANSLKINF
jgi:hypothetical protein